MRYANGVTFCTARSILSATLVRAVILQGSRGNYRRHGVTAMRGPYRSYRTYATYWGERRHRPPIALPRLHVSVFAPDKNGLHISWPSLIATLRKRTNLAETSRALTGAALFSSPSPLP